MIKTFLVLAVIFLVIASSFGCSATVSPSATATSTRDTIQNVSEIPLLPATTTSAENPTWKEKSSIYSDSKLGYSVEYPSSWQTIPTKSDGFQIGPGGGTSIAIQVENVPPAKNISTPKEYYAWYLASWQSQPMKTEVLSEGERQISENISGYQATLQFTLDGGVRKRQVFFTSSSFNGWSMYVVSYTAFDKDYPQYTHLFEEVLSSLKLSSPPDIKNTTTPAITTTLTIKTTPVSGEEAVVMSFDPNPVSSENGRVSFKVTLTETKGVGVSFKSSVIQRYSSSGQVSGTAITPNDSTRFFNNGPGTYLAANSSVYSQCLFGGQNGMYAIVTLTGIDDNGLAIVVEGRIDFSGGGASPSVFPTPTGTPNLDPSAAGIVTVSFDPNPVPIVIGQHASWKVILTETNGVGVTLKSVTRQFCGVNGPVGEPMTFTGTAWFQNLSGAYLPPYTKGIIGAGSGFGSSTPSGFYAIDTIKGLDDHGHEIVVNGRVDFIIHTE